MECNMVTRKMKKYSLEKERSFFDQAKSDRRAVPYEHLTKYIDGSVGREFFAGKRVLNLGSGEGVYSAWIADIGGAKEVVGVELTEHRIRRDYEKQLSNLMFIAGDFFHLFEYGVNRKAFDIVFMNLVLHHLRYNLEDIAGVIRDGLVEGGVFLAFEPNIYSPISVLAHLRSNKSPNEGFLSPQRIRKVFSSLGFGNTHFGYFWRDRKWARNPFFASTFWFSASVE